MFYMVALPVVIGSDEILVDVRMDPAYVHVRGRGVQALCPSWCTFARRLAATFGARVGT